MQNAFTSFNGSLLDEIIERTLFHVLAQARVALAMLAGRLQTILTTNFATRMDTLPSSP